MIKKWRLILNWKTGKWKADRKIDAVCPPNMFQTFYFSAMNKKELENFFNTPLKLKKTQIL